LDRFRRPPILALRWAFAAHFLASNGAVDDLLALVIVHCGQP
jgi:hypothetical protein